MFLHIMSYFKELLISYLFASLITLRKIRLVTTGMRMLPVEITPWNKILVEKLTGMSLSKKIKTLAQRWYYITVAFFNLLIIDLGFVILFLRSFGCYVMIF